MGKKLLRPVGATIVILVPGTAYAQYVPIWLVVAALSPLAVILLAAILGLVARSWRVGALHAGLVIVWVLLFGLASYFIENDYVIWTPLVLYAAHALLIVVLIVVTAVRRINISGDALS